MTTCSQPACDGNLKAKGLCKKHYMRLQRGTLDNPRYAKPRVRVGSATNWPIAVRKIDGVWHRRPSDCEDGTPWMPVVWETGTT